MPCRKTAPFAARPSPRWTSAQYQRTRSAPSAAAPEPIAPLRLSAAAAPKPPGRLRSRLPATLSQVRDRLWSETDPARDFTVGEHSGVQIGQKARYLRSALARSAERPGRSVWCLPILDSRPLAHEIFEIGEDSPLNVVSREVSVQRSPSVQNIKQSQQFGNLETKRERRVAARIAQ